MQILYDTLKKIEFIELNEYDPEKESVCPGCGSSRQEGHQRYCSIMRALETFKPKGGFDNENG